MTTLTFHLSHSLALALSSDEPKNIVVTRLDHDANVSPWLKMAQKIGAEVRWVQLADDGRSLDLEQFETLLDEQTVFAAIGYASNACGTINPVKDMIRQIK